MVEIALCTPNLQCNGKPVEVKKAESIALSKQKQGQSLDRCANKASRTGLDQNADRKPRRTKKVIGDTDVCRTKLTTRKPKSKLGGGQGATQDADGLVPSPPTLPQEWHDSPVSPQPELEPQSSVLSWAQRVRRSKAPAVPPCATADALDVHSPPPLTGAAGGALLHPAARGLAAPTPAGVAGGGSFAGAGGWTVCGGPFLGAAAGGGGGGTVAAALYALQDSFFNMVIDGGGDGGDGGGGAPPGRSRLATYQAGGGASPTRD